MSITIVFVYPRQNSIISYSFVVSIFLITKLVLIYSNLTPKLFYLNWLYLLLIFIILPKLIIINSIYFIFLINLLKIIIIFVVSNLIQFLIFQSHLINFINPLLFVMIRQFTHLIFFNFHSIIEIFNLVINRLILYKN